ncbi:putative head to tail connecting protein [Pseudomonas phage Ep4]|uniref:Head to tail connecting protein n=1 Tax=Pseudomonas phage Ep4 TaxID=3057492 RepID=A0AAU9E6V3_9CAUD|nr:putative head to tail connecting protein [Pseudomonas phage Ep4]
MHIPLAHILVNEVNPDFVSEVLAGGLKLSVLTGVSALGRSADVTKLLQVAQALSVILPVLTQSSQRMDSERVINRVFEGFGLNVEDYALTKEELQAKLAQAQQEQQAAQAQAGGGPVATDLSTVAGQISDTGVL